MITHIVLMKLKDRSATTIADVAQKLRDLEGKIPQLKFIEVGVNFTQSERAYDLALTTKFESKAALDEYQVHPAHLKFLEYYSPLRESSIIVDY